MKHAWIQLFTIDFIIHNQLDGYEFRFQTLPITSFQL